MSRILYYALLLALLSLALAGCQKQPDSSAVGRTQATPTPQPPPSPSPAAASPGAMKTTSSGLQYQDLVVGAGPRPLFNQRVRISYTGWLKSGTKFDSNTFTFRLGRGEVIKGWDMGIGGGKDIEAMRVGGKRKLIIPPELGYGSEAMSTIPPNSTLIFEVELIRAFTSSGFGLR
jgi:peptidylprolyl isomerase